MPAVQYQSDRAARSVVVCKQALGSAEWLGKIKDLEADETKFAFEELMQEAIAKIECIELEALTV